MNELENLREEEEEYRDNFPDNLLSCERYEIAENACYCLEEATQALEDAINNINESIEG